MAGCQVRQPAPAPLQRTASASTRMTMRLLSRISGWTFLQPQVGQQSATITILQQAGTVQQLAMAAIVSSMYLVCCQPLHESPDHRSGEKGGWTLVHAATNNLGASCLKTATQPSGRAGTQAAWCSAPSWLPCAGCGRSVMATGELQHLSVCTSQQQQLHMHLEQVQPAFLGCTSNLRPKSLKLLQVWCLHAQHAPPAQTVLHTGQVSHREGWRGPVPAGAGQHSSRQCWILFACRASCIRIPEGFGSCAAQHPEPDASPAVGGALSGAQ